MGLSGCQKFLIICRIEDLFIAKFANTLINLSNSASYVWTCQQIVMISDMLMSSVV